MPDLVTTDRVLGRSQPDRRRHVAHRFCSPPDSRPRGLSCLWWAPPWSSPPGVGREPNFQGFLRNRVSTYLGDISYSLYLAHWPVIVLLAAVMATDVYYYACVLTLRFGLAIVSYHFIENPLRYASRGVFVSRHERT